MARNCGDESGFAVDAADVEALLVNRVGSAREYFLVPIDECYRLVGLIRIHWRGLSGGSLVWGEIAAFFDDLRRRASLSGKAHHAGPDIRGRSRRSGIVCRVAYDRVPICA